MKRKNLKGLIHNFAHSLQSFDFTHSSIVVFNVLADVYSEFGINYITFDFINNEIIPESMNTEEARIILDDYTEWLPNLAKSHNADTSEIEELKIKIEIDFSKHKHPDGMVGVVELEMKTTADYKIKDRSNEQILISEIDVYGEKIMPPKLKKEFWGKK